MNAAVRRSVEQVSIARPREPFTTNPELFTHQPPKGWMYAKTPGANSSVRGDGPRWFPARSVTSQMTLVYHPARTRMGAIDREPG